MKRYLRKHFHPNGSGFLLLQVGGNDIGAISQKAWILELESAIFYVQARCPGYTIVWSDIFQRDEWRHCASRDMGVRKRRRIQRYARKIVWTEGGHVLKHPGITFRALRHDGVHLSREGNRLLKISLERQLRRLLRV